MSVRAVLADPALSVALALVAAMLLVASEHRRRLLSGSLGLLLVLVPCALVLARLDAAGWILAPLVATLVAAALARERPDPLPGECALKLVWVLGGAFALTAVGLALLALATGVTAPPEQWSVLQLGLSQRMVWVVALPLALLAGVVLLGGAPFHFWVADLFQGAPAALAPLAVAALQGLGAMWLVQRLAGLEGFGDGAALAGALLRTRRSSPARARSCCSAGPSGAWAPSRACRAGSHWPHSPSPRGAVRSTRWSLPGSCPGLHTWRWRSPVRRCSRASHPRTRWRARRGATCSGAIR
jgi:hypothetical protein